MKKLLLLGFILAILLLAFPQGVMAETITPEAVTVNAEYLYKALEFDADTAPDFNWDLIESGLGTEMPLGNQYTDALVFTVDSPLDWDVTATDTSETAATSEGYLYSLTAAVKTLANPFMIASDNEGTGGMISIVGGPIIESGVPADVGFSKTIDQIVEQEDYAANDYSITITFACTNAWTPPPEV